MADTVRYLMEQMVPELEDMQKKRYFSRQEVKEIVRKRQEFEYKLKRKAALKEDFLRCAAAAAVRCCCCFRRRRLGVHQHLSTMPISFTASPIQRESRSGFTGG